MSSHDNYWKRYGLWDSEYVINSITDSPIADTSEDYLHSQDIPTPSQSKEVEVQIIPKLKETNEISLSKGDTLVVYLPEELKSVGADELQEISEVFDKMFPDNQVLFLPNTFKLGVIKNV